MSISYHIIPPQKNLANEVKKAKQLNPNARAEKVLWGEENDKPPTFVAIYWPSEKYIHKYTWMVYFKLGY